jgi:tetratricopeptide (TPR) repeat protein
MPNRAIRAAKRRQAVGITAFLLAVTAGVSVLYHFVRADAVAYHRAEKAFARRDYAAALSHYEHAGAAGFAPATLRWHQAVSLAETGRHAEALVLLREILAENPRDSQALPAAVGLAQRLGDPAAGLALYATLGPREELPPADLIRLADLHQQAGQLEDAIACARLASAATPSAELLVWLGELHSRAQDKTGAIGAFESALRLDPANRPARLALARALAWDGRLADSAKAYRAYLGQN